MDSNHNCSARPDVDHDAEDARISFRDQQRQALMKIQSVVANTLRDLFRTHGNKPDKTDGRIVTIDSNVSDEHLNCQRSVDKEDDVTVNENIYKLKAEYQSMKASYDIKVHLLLKKDEEIVQLQQKLKECEDKCRLLEVKVREDPQLPNPIKTKDEESKSSSSRSKVVKLKVKLPQSLFQPYASAHMVATHRKSAWIPIALTRAEDLRNDKPYGGKFAGIVMNSVFQASLYEHWSFITWNLQDGNQYYKVRYKHREICIAETSQCLRCGNYAYVSTFFADFKKSVTSYWPSEGSKGAKWRHELSRLEHKIESLIDDQWRRGLKKDGECVSGLRKRAISIFPDIQVSNKRQRII